MRSLLILLSALLPVLATAQNLAGNPDVFQLRIQSAAVQPTAAGGSVAVSALIINPTSSTLVITGAATPMAGQTLLQRYMKDKNGLVQLVPIEALPLPPHSETVLAPGALELQLVGTTQELQSGLEIPLTIRFAEGTERVVRLHIE
jgi:copper(I)-binding protein